MKKKRNFDTMPDEVLETIFHWMDHKSKENCSKICRRFRSILSKDSFWLDHARFLGISEIFPSVAWRKAAKENKFLGSAGTDSSNFKFNYRNMVLTGRGFSVFRLNIDWFFEQQPDKVVNFLETNRHFRLEPECQEGFLLETNGGTGCDPQPDVTTCIAFSEGKSFYWDLEYTYQDYQGIDYFIDLVDSGIDEWVMDFVRPKIRITQMINYNNDVINNGGCSYASLYGRLNKSKDEWKGFLSSHDPSRFKSRGFQRYGRMNERHWVHVTLDFDDYPSGIRFLHIMNLGTGIYVGKHGGPKFANLKITFTLPEEPILKPYQLEVVREEEEW